MNTVAKPEKTKTRNSPSRIAVRVFTNLVMILYSITCVYPIVWIFYSSVKTNRDFQNNILGLPKAFVIGNYIYVLTSGKIGM